MGTTTTKDVGESGRRNCPKCIRDVRQAGDKCPHCGYAGPGHRSALRVILSVIGVIVGLELIVPLGAIVIEAALAPFEWGYDLGHVRYDLAAIWAAGFGIAFLRLGISGLRK